ncbi:MAG: DUF4365 domain-containing protein [Sphingobacteriales bacterium]|nr:MAG: DUF4365 domain-containing protein [Sphingobacteriales bacterium]
MKRQNFPIRHPNTVLESFSEQYFKSLLPSDWYVDKPIDYGIDLVVSPVIRNQVTGLSFSVQLKAQHRSSIKLSVRIKKSTLNYLFARLEPCMIVLYDHHSRKANWRQRHGLIIFPDNLAKLHFTLNGLLSRRCQTRFGFLPWLNVNIRNAIIGRLW